jgi:hypothetical protein
LDGFVHNIFNDVADDNFAVAVELINGPILERAAFLQ